MKRIFLTLAIVSQVLLVATLVMGLDIGDAKLRENRPAVSDHMLMALGSLVFAIFIHALILTYFMGTGRWMEETSRAYKLSPDYCRESSRLKYGTFPLMILSVFLLIVTGAFGAASDPRNATGFDGWFGLTGKQIHFTVACATICVNLFVNIREYLAIDRNGQLIKRAMEEVHRIRREHHLPV